MAALSLAATQVAQLSLRYSSISQAHPTLRPRLATGIRLHAAHFAELKKAAGTEPPRPGKLPAVPPTASAALADLAAREQKLAVAHSLEAAKLSGAPARLLAMLAASENQLATSLAPPRNTGANARGGRGLPSAGREFDDE